ncbi:MAG: hypothetical protein EOP04_06275 [Proteobacteria bacterium]|nr:MAG: hypothetical protein EOP04_06275 [Pseudomonadota bacterium]
MFKILTAIAAAVLIYFITIPLKYSSTSFIAYNSPSRQIPLSLQKTSEINGLVSETLNLNFRGGWGWSTLASLDLVFFTSQTNPTIKKAVLISSDGCQLEGVQPIFSFTNLLRFRHPDFSTLTFKVLDRSKCNENSKSFLLSLERTSDSKFGIWANDGDVKTSSRFIQVSDPSAVLVREANGSVLMGRIVENQVAPSIFETITPNLRTSEVTALCFALCLLGVAAFGLYKRELNFLSVVMSAIYAFVIMFSFIYVIPPFQNADEPDHFISLFEDAKAQDALLLGHKSELERIKFHYLESTTEGGDTRALGLGPISWGSHIVPIIPYQFRSPLAAKFYKYAGKFVSDIYSARLLGVLVLATFILFILSLGRYMQVPAQSVGSISLIAILVVPVTYYASVVTNYGLLASLSYLYSSIFMIALLSRYNSSKFFVVDMLLTLVALAIYATSVNGIFILIFHGAFVLFTFVQRLKITDFHHDALSRFHYVYLFIPIGLGSWLIEMSNTDLQVLNRGAELLRRFDGSVALIEWAQNNIILSRFSAFCLPYLSLFILEQILSVRSVQTLRTKLPKFFHSLLVIATVFITAYVALRNVSVPFITQGLPAEIAASQLSISTSQYSAAVLYDFFKSMLGGYPNFMVVQSFWGGFGWLDMSMPVLYVQLVMLGSTLGLLSLSQLRLVRHNDNKGLAFILFFLAFIASIALAATSAMKLGIDIVGRYLLVPYIFVFSLCFLGLMERARNSRNPVYSTFGLIVVYLPLIAILTILDRYYLILGGRI